MRPGIVVLCILLSACDKPIETDQHLADLRFVQTNTPRTAAANENVVSSVRVAGPDLCYRFSQFIVNQQQSIIDIRAKGTYPARPVACATAIYYKDTTVTVTTGHPGTYILRFYNESQLFKSDTVEVN